LVAPKPKLKIADSKNVRTLNLRNIRNPQKVMMKSYKTNSTGALYTWFAVRERALNAQNFVTNLDASLARIASTQYRTSRLQVANNAQFGSRKTHFFQ
jgi:hypothetical protein